MSDVPETGADALDHAPTVSVVIPARDAASTVATAVASARAQVSPPHEVFVVDDGSSDGTGAVAAAAGATVVEGRGGGAGAARNLGLTAATGEWIALLDADDEWLPTHLADALRWTRSTGADCFMGLTWHRRDGAVIERASPWASFPDDGAATALDLDDYAARFRVAAMLNTSTVVFRRSALDDVGGFDETLERRQDLDLWLRLLRTRAWCYDARPHAIYRVDTPGNLSSDVPARTLATVVVLARHADAEPSLRPALRAAAHAAARAAMRAGSREGLSETLRVVGPDTTMVDRAALTVVARVPGLAGAVAGVRRVRRPRPAR